MDAIGQLKDMMEDAALTVPEAILDAEYLSDNLHGEQEYGPAARMWRLVRISSTLGPQLRTHAHWYNPKPQRNGPAKPLP